MDLMPEMGGGGVKPAFELEREKWRRIFQEMEGRHREQMLKEERELSERESMPPEMQGFWLG